MIDPKKIEEWIKEAEERPGSAAKILRIIANRLVELAQHNEELLGENIALRSEKRVEEYETRIANLEYQVELLKRQLNGQTQIEPARAEATDTKQSLILYTPQGFVQRVEFEPGTVETGSLLASFDPAALTDMPRLLVTRPHEELMLAFSSGRTVTLPVSALDACQPGEFSWDEAYYQEPVGLEELLFIKPIARMALAEMCITASRKGYVKKAKESFFEGYITKNYIGTGVKLLVDKALNLIFCQESDTFVMASREGYILSLPVAMLPLSIEEAFKLGSSDHVVSAFALSGKRSLLIVTSNGKAVLRESGWLAPAEKLLIRGQALLSNERREAGIRIAGSAAVGDSDWGSALTSSGKVLAYRIADLAAAGSLKTGDDPVLEFETFGEA